METKNSESTTQKANCPKHAMSIDFTCVDPSCGLNVDCCMFCVKEFHSSCNDDFIIENERLDSVFEIKLDEGNMEEEKKRFSEALQAQENKFQAKTDDLLEGFDTLIKGDFSNLATNKTALMLLKKFYKLSYNEDSKSFEAESLFNVVDAESQLICDHLRNDLFSIYQGFIKQVEGNQLDLGSTFKLNSFVCHKNIKICKKGRSISVSRVPGNSENNYFSAVYQIPLKSSLKLEILIEGVNPGDLYLGVGIIEDSKFKSITTDPIISFAKEIYSYCGTSQLGMSGSFESAKFQSGFVFRMEFNQSTEILAFSTKDKQVSLTKTNLSKGHSYYFFVTLYYPESACVIKSIK
jgi:hypothetical protein